MPKRHHAPRERRDRGRRRSRKSAHPRGRPSAAATRDLLYGRQPVRECLLAQRRKVHALLLANGTKPTPELDELRTLAEQGSVPIRMLDPAEMDDRVAGGHHQGVALDVAPYPYAAFDPASLAPPSEDAAELVLLLDHVQDPQNLGAILRSADGAGVRSVLLPADRACGVTPTVVRASAGAAEHLAVASVTNLVRCMRALKQAGYWVIGVEADAGAVVYSEADLARPTALVVGSEGKGLGRLVRETCDTLIALPMGGHVTSLNVNAATAIALYEVRRQQGMQDQGGMAPA